MSFTLVSFLHMATMFMAVSAILGTEWPVLCLALVRDVHVIRSMLPQARSFGRVGPPLLGLASVFGLVAARLGDFDFTAPWLVISYAHVVLIAINGQINSRRWVSKKAAADASSLDAPSPELRGLISDKRALFAFLADIVLIILAVFVMVVKPGGA
jgi:hypothetical protein